MSVNSAAATQKLVNKSIMKHFPKVELHRHLEGTFALETLFRIARQNNIGLSDDFAEFKTQVQFPRDSEPDFLTFLSKFRNDWYRSHQDVYDIVHDSVAEMAEDGIHYIELRFSPEHFSHYNNFDREEITRLVIQAANTAAKEAGFTIRYLLTFNRSKQDQYEMIKLYDRMRELDIPEIIGIDLAGDEKGDPPENFTEFFAHVKQDNRYKITIHAGEVTPSQQIWFSIDNLHADRIGHGVSAIHDPEVQQELIKRDVALEQCITSNYQTGSWADEQNHPLGALYRAGVPVTINSDDPFIQDTDLTDDYIKTVEYFGFTLEDLINLNHIAIRTSFLPDQEKTTMLQSYDEQVQRFVTTYLKD
ncbi:adenosine deaminase [Spirochaeta africana]|uniref:adenosine deaminase n=1 Tax=Spirochaeta africana (strain ATCC 700263 / DSM 8902 / Z-7692) TaxID=889378 RepID=H9UMZ6_SPIAZ|nr:adenosine deaminase [Spirochaeta africana]AFG38889.1 adenosine deaminase [Spirochaeta africana DSM 8902]